MKDFIRYDITLVERVNKTDFKVHYIYPNEDNQCDTPTIWTSKHYYDGTTTIEDFSNNIECDAYLEEDLKNLSQAMNYFKGEKLFFETEKDLERDLMKLPIGAFGVVMYFN